MRKKSFKNLILQAAHREGMAILKARQWQPKIKSKAQVKRRPARIIYFGQIWDSERGTFRRRIKTPRHTDNPLDFALSPESLAIAEATADFNKVFGPVLEPVALYRPRRGVIKGSKRGAYAKRAKQEIESTDNLNDII